MLLQDMLDGYDICNLMYDQNLLTKEDDDYAAYVAGNMTPFQLLSDKIAKLEITPAQLALDPCSGSAVITDPNTGAIFSLCFLSWLRQQPPGKPDGYRILGKIEYR